MGLHTVSDDSTDHEHRPLLQQDHGPRQISPRLPRLRAPTWPQVVVQTIPFSMAPGGSTAYRHSNGFRCTTGQGHLHDPLVTTQTTDINKTPGAAGPWTQMKPSVAVRAQTSPWSAGPTGLKMAPGCSTNQGHLFGPRNMCHRHPGPYKAQLGGTLVATCLAFSPCPGGQCDIDAPLSSQGMEFDFL